MAIYCYPSWLGSGEVENRYRSVETSPAWQLKRIADALEELVEQNDETREKTKEG